jgi:predicted CopG family antitoxin
MANTTITISPELAENLQKLADAKQLSVSDFLEDLIEWYEVESAIQAGEIEEPSDAEIAAVRASIEEANQPGAIWYDDDEFDEELDRVIAERRARRQTGAA